MAEGHIVWKQCPGCDGTGVNPKFVVTDPPGTGSIVDDTCPVCNGNKYLMWGWMSKDNATIPDFLPEIE